MSKSWIRVRWLVVIGFLYVIAACGGPSNDGDVEPGNASPPVTSERVLGIFKAAQRSGPDQDDDGIPDSVDPFPAFAPALADDIDNFHLGVVAAFNDQFVWPGIVHADLSVRFTMSDLSAASGPFHAVFLGSDAIDVVALERQGQALVLRDASSLQGNYSRVFVITPVWMTGSENLQFFNASEPLLAGQLVLERGTQQSVPGINLAEVTAVWLNGQLQDDLPVVQNSALSFNIRPDAVSGTLELTSTQLPALPAPQDIPVEIIRRTEVLIDRGDDFFGGPLTWVSRHGVTEIASGDTTAEIITSTGRPTLHSFVPVVGFDHPLFRQLVTWPNDDTVNLSRESILEAIVVGNLPFLFERPPLGWEEQKDWIDELLTNFPIQTALSVIDDRITNPDSVLTSDVLSALASSASDLESMRVTNKQFRTISRKKIFESAVTTDVFGSEIPRSEYSRFEIGVEESLGCAASASNALVQGVQKFDICVANRSAAFASVAVYVVEPDLALSNPSRGRATEKLDHIRQRAPGAAGEIAFLFDPAVIGSGTGGVFSRAAVSLLQAEDKSALCGMRNCYVELLTGGWGLGVEQNLTEKQRKVADAMFLRTLLEQVALPFIESATGGQLEKFDKSCVDKLVVSKWLSLGLNFEQFAVALDGDQSSSNLRAVLSANLLDPISQILLEGLWSKCLYEPMFASALAGAIEQTVGTAASRAAVVLDIADKLTTVVELLSMPRKITFIVKPLAEVKTGHPKAIRIVQFGDDLDELELGGTFLAIQNATDQADEYLPTIRITDASGNEVVHRVEPFEFDDGAQPDSDCDLTDLNTAFGEGGGCLDVIPGLFEGIENLLPGPAFIQVEIDDYEPFDANNPLVLPGGYVNLQTEPRIFGLQNGEQAAFAGQRLALRGYRLDGLGADPNVVLEEEGNAGAGMVNASRVEVRRDLALCPDDALVVRCPESDHRTFVDFTVPDSIETTRSYQVIYTAGTRSVSLAEPIMILGEGAAIINFADAGTQSDDVMVLTVSAASAPVMRLQIPYQGSYSTQVALKHLAAGDQARIRCLNGGTDGVCTPWVSIRRGNDANPEFESPPYRLSKGEEQVIPLPTTALGKRGQDNQGR